MPTPINFNINVDYFSIFTYVTEINTLLSLTRNSKNIERVVVVMSNVAAKVLASVAEKAGEVALKQAFKEYGGESGQKLSESLFGGYVERKVDKIDEQLNKLSANLEKSLDIIKRKTSDIHITQLFNEYNKCVNNIKNLLEDYNDYKEESLKDSINKRNSYKNLLSSNGILYQVKSMLLHLTSKQQPINKSYLEYYAFLLLEDYPDVFNFCNKLDSLIEHCTFYLVLAISLQQNVKQEAQEHNKIYPSPDSLYIEIHDVDMKPTDEKILDSHYYAIATVQDAKKIYRQFDECQGVTIMLQHLPDQKYLTGYKDGNALSEVKPFEWLYHIKAKGNKEGMPQIFLNGLLTNREVREYRDRIETTGLFGEVTGAKVELRHVKLDGKAQKWKLIKKNENGIIYFIFQHQESGLVLDGINNGRVYLSKLDDNNPHLRWQPILTKNPSGYFILRHLHQGFALDSDSSRVYAEGRNPDHENIAMKWRLVTDTLFPDEFLEPGQKLLSMNGKISLTYEQSGVLVLFDRAENKELWKSRQGQLGAWRCCMQEDGNFVTYAKENVPTWASNTMKPGGRLIVRDSGDLVITAQNGNTIWSSI
ncbi:RICIN domain-containing protein [Nostoc sp. WHI]|uniref:RICIN domain-containing protein n=1 Tax=Nostoc sp. WHI TaxID=2650611 RepID=UPI0018C65DF2|nr:RICIN domain-containing protein [Nostoc sp. WHI]